MTLTAADYLEGALDLLQKAESEMLSISTDPELSNQEGWENCTGEQYSISLASAGGRLQSAIAELKAGMKLIGLDSWEGINMSPNARTKGL